MYYIVIDHCGIQWFGMQFYVKSLTVAVCHTSNLHLFIPVVESVIYIYMDLSRGNGTFSKWSVLQQQ